jgi:hypothetical protein
MILRKTEETRPGGWGNREATCDYIFLQERAYRGHGPGKHETARVALVHAWVISGDHHAAEAGLWVVDYVDVLRQADYVREPV